MKTIVALSGAICSGKTTLTNTMRRFYGCSVLSTRSILEKAYTMHAIRPIVDASREDLHALGDNLDSSTDGSWIATSVEKFMAVNPSDIIIIDCVRSEVQKGNLVELAVSKQCCFLHIHVVADFATRQKRWTEDRGEKGSPPRQTTEEDQLELSGLVLSSLLPPNMVVDMLDEHILETNALPQTKTYDVLVGGQYGSEGKGHVADHIADQYDILLRGGGPNAGHTVWNEPLPVVFHHLPSAAHRNREAPIFLVPGAVINPRMLVDEADRCNIDHDRIFIDHRAQCISSDDILQEEANLKSIGSTAQGVGAASIRKMWRSDTDTLAENDEILQSRFSVIDMETHRAMWRGKRILVEGTQGTGLSLHHGKYPYVTSRDTSTSGILSEAGVAQADRVIMVCRTHPIRVQSPQGGTSGPMSEETSFEDISRTAGLDLASVEEREITTTTKRKRRVSSWDWSLFHRNVEINRPTDIALTFLDYIDAKNQEATCFEELTDETKEFIEAIEKASRIPVSIMSTAFHPDRIFSR